MPNYYLLSQHNTRIYCLSSSFLESQFQLHGFYFLFYVLFFINKNNSDILPLIFPSTILWEELGWDEVDWPNYCSWLTRLSLFMLPMLKPLLTLYMSLKLYNWLTRFQLKAAHQVYIKSPWTVSTKGLSTGTNDTTDNIIIILSERTDAKCF